MAIFPCAVSVQPNDSLVRAVAERGAVYNSSQSASNHSIFQFLAIQSRVPF